MLEGSESEWNRMTAPVSDSDQPTKQFREFLTDLETKPVAGATSLLHVEKHFPTQPFPQSSQPLSLTK